MSQVELMALRLRLLSEGIRHSDDVAAHAIARGWLEEDPEGDIVVVTDRRYRITQRGQAVAAEHRQAVRS